MRLQEASFAVLRAKETLSRIDQSLADSARSDEASLREGRSAAEIQFALLARNNMNALRETFLDEVHRLELEREVKVDEYRRAYREREVLATLSAQQQHTYQQEHRQREQREFDAIHLMQLWRKHRD